MRDLAFLKRGRNYHLYQLQQDFLKWLHAGQLYLTKYLHHAKQNLYWLEHTSDLLEIANNSQVCLKYSNKIIINPQASNQVSKDPLSFKRKLTSDLFYLKNSAYLQYVDYCSKFLVSCKLGRMIVKNVASYIKAISHHTICHTSSHQWNSYMKGKMTPDLSLSHDVTEKVSQVPTN